ncbi:MAG: redox-sensing transcriptional repressor Rex [Clostridia bacterium]|nr:redox-sensing transcriptional repressor Rex [Clostridia bacterium]
MKKSYSLSTLQRLPTYYHYLKGLSDSVKTISATQIAKALGLGEVQVRKDLAEGCGEGRPKVGYDRKILIEKLKKYLGCGVNTTPSIIIGTGKLGQALMGYKGFDDYGLKILAGFDVREGVVGNRIGDKEIYHVSKIEDFVKTNQIKLAILTLPDVYAQEMANVLVKAGVEGIWNFSPAHITAKKDVVIRNENLAASLAILSRQMEDKSNKVKD